MGHGSAARLHEVLPDRYRFHEQQEDHFREFIGSPVSMLTDRRGDGLKKPLSLKVFRERIEQGETIDWSDRGACSCFENDADVAPETAGAM
jgi:hypothetical protein